MDSEKTIPIISLVLGILSIVLILPLLAFIYIPLACGIIGMVLAIRERKYNPSGMLTAAMVVSIIGTILCALILVVMLLGLGMMSSMVGSILPGMMDDVADGNGGFTFGDSEDGGSFSFTPSSQDGDDESPSGSFSFDLDGFEINEPEDDSGPDSSSGSISFSDSGDGYTYSYGAEKNESVPELSPYQNTYSYDSSAEPDMDAGFAAA